MKLIIEKMITDVVLSNRAAAVIITRFAARVNGNFLAKTIWPAYRAGSDSNSNVRRHMSACVIYAQAAGIAAAILRMTFVAAAQ